MSITTNIHEQTFNNPVSDRIISTAGRIANLSNAVYAAGFNSRVRMANAYDEQYENLSARNLNPRAHRYAAIMLTSLVAIVTVINFLWVATPQTIQWAETKRSELQNIDFTFLSDVSEWTTNIKAQIQSWGVDAQLFSVDADTEEVGEEPTATEAKSAD